MIQINVYDDEGKIIKTVTGEPVHFRFGTIRKLMKLVEVEKAEDTGELLSIVGGAWKEITRILSRCFPEMSEDDWDGVEINELIPTVIEIVKDAVSEINKIPGDKEKKTDSGLTEPLYKSLFDLEYVICREFSSLSPFILEEKEYGEVIELFADLRDMQIRNEDKHPELKQQKETTTTEKNGHKIIRRPAGDSWF